MIKLKSPTSIMTPAVMYEINKKQLSFLSENLRPLLKMFAFEADVFCDTGIMNSLMIKSMLQIASRVMQGH